MASTVDSAFAEFLRDTVNLAADTSSGARTSRTWLRGQLATFHDKHDDFPRPYADKHIDYGSFARRTKTRPLDDIDIIHCLTGEGATYSDERSRITITPATGTRLAGFCHADSDLLNSRRVINKFIKHLDGVPQYSAARIKQSGVAATLELSSYDWNFDIVPGFFTTPELDGRTYYIIPNGDGHWMKTDPRLDQDRVTTVNQKHAGRVLNVVRVLKFWNRRPTMPSVPSYAFENLVLDHYAGRFDEASEYIDLEIPKVFDHIASGIYGAIQDPKGIQGDLNTLEYGERMKVSARASSDAAKAREARNLESQGSQKASIEKWGEVFGSTFPSYTG